MVTLHEVITFLVSMQISISSLQTHNVNRCGRSRHLGRKLSRRRKRSSPNVSEMAATETITSIILFFFQAEDGIRDLIVTGVQTCALPILEANMSAGHTVLTLLSADITAVPGVGASVAARLHNLGIRSVRDLLFYFPREHREDRKSVV